MFIQKLHSLRMNMLRKSSVFALSIAATACAGDPVDGEPELPKIVEVFACSDYCPGPEEKYMKRVYDGITDEVECRKLGGKPFTFIGWGQQTICEVK
ncbi:MAG: hypothetical protein AAFN50_05475 [Pseudomonadota bacterium]